MKTLFYAFSIQLFVILSPARHVIAFGKIAHHPRRTFRIRAFATDEQLDEILQVAIDASQKAGDIILQHADGADVVDTKSTGRDLLTRVDPLCEMVCHILFIECCDTLTCLMCFFLLLRSGHPRNDHGSVS